MGKYVLRLAWAGLCLVLPVLMPGCATTGSDGTTGGGTGSGPTPPDWWANPNQEMFPGSAAACRDEAAARQAAHDAALAEIARKLGTEVVAVGGEFGTRFSVSARHQIKGTEIRFQHAASQSGRWWAWALVAYPRSEYEKQLELLDKPRREFSQALACRQAEPRQAEAILEGILAAYPLGTQTVFPSEVALLEQARIVRGWNVLRAADLYRRLQATPGIDGAIRSLAQSECPNTSALKPEERVRAHLDGRPLAVLCVDRDSNASSSWGDTVCERLRSFGIETVALTGIEGAVAPAAVAGAAHSQGAGVALVFGLRLKRIKPFPDSDLERCLADAKWELYAGDGKVLGGGGYAGKDWPKGAESQAVQTAINILVTKKLDTEVKWPAW